MFELIKLELPLKYTWKISRSATDHKVNFIIKYTNNGITSYGEIAPNLRYGETEEKIIKDFETFNSLYSINAVNTVDEFITLKDSIDISHSLQFGLESAFIHYIAKIKNRTIYEYFNLNKPDKVYTSYSLPIMEIGEIETFLLPLKEFKYLKIKVNHENAYETLMEVTKHTKQKLFVDGNESWTDVDQLIKFIHSISHMPISFIEQPMPSSLKEEYKKLKKNCPFPLIADESIENQANFEDLKEQFDGINIKLMKTGGYIRALNLINEAKKNHMKIMIGCMVETSLGIQSALNLCSTADYVDLDGFLIVKDEPFNCVKVKDGELMFNSEGFINI